MFRIFAAFVRRIALGFYETGLLTLPHFFFLSLSLFFFFTRFRRASTASQARCTTEEKFESSIEGNTFRESFSIFWKIFALEEDSLMIRGDSCWLLTINNQHHLWIYYQWRLINETVNKTKLNLLRFNCTLHANRTLNDHFAQFLSLSLSLSLSLFLL